MVRDTFQICVIIAKIQLRLTSVIPTKRGPSSPSLGFSKRPIRSYGVTPKSKTVGSEVLTDDTMSPRRLFCDLSQLRISECQHCQRKGRNVLLLPSPPGSWNSLKRVFRFARFKVFRMKGSRNRGTVSVRRHPAKCHRNRDAENTCLML